MTVFPIARKFRPEMPEGPDFCIPLVTLETTFINNNQLEIPLRRKSEVPSKTIPRIMTDSRAQYPRHQI
jgi:hypothetical protein